MRNAYTQIKLFAEWHDRLQAEHEEYRQGGDHITAEHKLPSLDELIEREFGYKRSSFFEIPSCQKAHL